MRNVGLSKYKGLLGWGVQGATVLIFDLLWWGSGSLAVSDGVMRSLKLADHQAASSLGLIVTSLLL